jgi:hypothetical protein
MPVLVFKKNIPVDIMLHPLIWWCILKDDDSADITENELMVLYLDFNVSNLFFVGDAVILSKD